jgi:hypothetical protein
MRIFRPLLLSSVIAVCVAPLAAQSLTKESALPPNAQASADVFQFVQPFDILGITLRPTVPGAESKDDSQAVLPKDLLRRRIMTREEDQLVCYALRTYRVVREAPDSDSTRPAGYSTCQRAGRFQLKTAVESRETAPR